MHSSSFSRSKIAPGTSSSFSFTFSCFFFFNSTFHFAILSCFNPAETFHSAFRMFVYIRVPPNNAINGSTPSLGPRLSLFSEVSYYKKLVWVPQIFNICRNALGHLMKFTQHSVLWAGASRFIEEWWPCHAIRVSASLRRGCREDGCGFYEDMYPGPSSIIHLVGLHRGVTSSD